MAPSFAALRSSRKRDGSKKRELDDRFGDSSISAPNEGATWVEYARPQTSLDTRERSRPVSPAMQQRQEGKSSITITINLPWQKKSRRASSLPPKSRVQPRADEGHEARILEDRPRPSAITRTPTLTSPSSDKASKSSPTLRQGQRFRSTSDSTSPMHSGTSALSVLSPLAESFAGPKTPASAFTENATSIENSPNSPRKAIPTEEEFAKYHSGRTHVMPDRAYNPQSRQHAPRYRTDDKSEDPGPNAYNIDARFDAVFEMLPRRAKSVDPTMRTRPGADNNHYTNERTQYYRYSGSSTSSAENQNQQSNSDFHDSPHPDARPIRRSLSRSSSRPAGGSYGDITKDYSQIIRAVATNATSPPMSSSQTSRLRSDPSSQPGSAGSGYSYRSESQQSGGDADIPSGPQELVPNGEDLWG